MEQGQPAVETYRRWQRMIRILETPNEDLRHLVLDVLPDFLELTESTVDIPESLQAEVADLRAELDQARPMFPSHRNTSSLFDREGMGRVGRDRGLRLAARIRAVGRTLLSASEPDKSSGADRPKPTRPTRQG